MAVGSSGGGLGSHKVGGKEEFPAMFDAQGNALVYE